MACGKGPAHGKGRSFDDTFAASYSAAKVKKATEEQRRLYLMAQEVRRLHRKHGGLTMWGNRYWSPWMNEFAGQRVVARFDPEHLHEGCHLYTLQGEFLGPPACSGKTGFFDIASAKAHARWQSQAKAAERKLLKTLRTISVEQYAEELAALHKAETPLVEAKVVEMTPARARKPLVEKPVPVPDTSRDAELTVLQVDFATPRQPEARPQDAEITRFWRMIDIERRSEAGEPVSTEDAEFYGRLKDHPTYLAQRDLYDRHGAQASLTLHRTGEVLTINGADLDLSVLPEGAILPASAVGCDWLAGPIRRLEGVLHLTLILPHGAEAPVEARFPAPLDIDGDGPVALPVTHPTEEPAA